MAMIPGSGLDDVISGTDQGDQIVLFEGDLRAFGGAGTDACRLIGGFPSRGILDMSIRDGVLTVDGLRIAEGFEAYRIDSGFQQPLFRDDVLHGGVGSERLEGREGDVIDISGIDANPLTGADDAFVPVAPARSTASPRVPGASATC
jgi:hypothetical protein